MTDQAEDPAISAEDIAVAFGAPNSLAAALAALQANLPHIGKDKTARVTSQRTGKSHSYDYANLATVSAAILPRMAAHGLAFITKPTMGPDGFALVYRLLHVGGESEDGIYPLPGSGSPQEIGSAITYARRYCLCAVTGVAPDDDDDDAQAAEKAARADGLPVNKDGSLSRSRTTDAEKDAAGNMTSEQWAEHTALQKGADGKLAAADRATRESAAATPSDDPFYEQGPAPDIQPGPSRGQLQKMFDRFAQLGVTDDEAMRADIGGILARPVESRSSLTAAEVTKVNRALFDRLAEVPA